MRLRFLLAPALVLSVAAAVAGEQMSSDDIGKTFEGVTLDGIYADGSFFSETYFEDGSIRYHDTAGSDSGEWSVSGDTFCTFYEGQTGACFFVERDGLNCFTFYEAIEDQNGRLAPRSDWTSRGWDRRGDSTCPSPPEAEI